MPLSEHEQRMLDQIEQALYAEDPKFAHAVRSTNPQVHYKRRIAKAAFGFVVGVGALMTGLVMNAGTVTIVVSVTGFLLMVVCCVWALTSWKRMTGVGAEGASGTPGEGQDPGQQAPGGPQAQGRGGTPGPARGGRSGRKGKPRTGFMDRMEERWRRRTEGD